VVRALRSTLRMSQAALARRSGLPLPRKRPRDALAERMLKSPWTRGIWKD
jgi:hypothetical protein